VALMRTLMIFFSTNAALLVVVAGAGVDRLIDRYIVAIIGC
jgi:hypothetical protein